MLKTRVIPTLLLRGAGLVKTTGFTKPVYVGDPINAIRIFNEKEVDELVLLDITASRADRGPAFNTIENIASECFMPVAYGGGISSVDEIRKILGAGIEKVVINTAALANPQIVRDAADEFGSQAIVVSMDVKRKWLGRYEVYRDGGSRPAGHEPVLYARKIQDLGAGEILLTAIDRDGTMKGYDIELIVEGRFGGQHSRHRLRRGGHGRRFRRGVETRWRCGGRCGSDVCVSRPPPRRAHHLSLACRTVRGPELSRINACARQSENRYFSVLWL